MFVDSMMSDIESMVSEMIVKRSDIADKQDTLNIIRAYDLYLTFLYNSDFKYIPLDLDILDLILPPSIDMVKAQLDRSLIPEIYHSVIYDAHKERYFTNYVERNNYYRTLYGLPNNEDVNFLFINGVTGIPDGTPVHELTNEQIGLISINGVLNQLIEDNPTKEYLKFLGTNKIHFSVARKAKNLEILRLGLANSKTNEKIFRTEYFKAWRFHMSTIYMKEKFEIDEVYDGFIGLLILTSAINNSISTNQNMTLSETFLDNMLKSYGIYNDFATLPLIYKKRLVLNLDKLISKRGTDAIMVDISEIFGYDNVIANRYYLMKTHNKDINGNPIFPKTGEGEIDYDAQYDIKFLKVDVAKDHLDLDSSDSVSYESLTEQDPFWQMTTISDLKRDEFNIMMSKYMSVEAAYNLTALSYELSYFMNLMLDMRDSLKTEFINKYSAGERSNLFTYIVFLLTVSAAKSAYDGNIPLAPAYIGEINKFNLLAVETAVQNIITEYNLPIKVKDIMLSNPNNITSSPSDIIDVYVKNSGIYDKILKARNEANDYLTYTGYDNLITMLFTCENISNVYRKQDGNIAETYRELLDDLDISLGLVIDQAISDGVLDDVYLYILNSLQSIFNTDTLQFLFVNTPEMNDTVLKVHFRNMIERFKAPKVELNRVDIYFSIDKDSVLMRVFDNVIMHDEFTGHDSAVMLDTIKEHTEYLLIEEITGDQTIEIYY